VLLIKYYSGDQIRKNVLGRAYGMHGEEERCIQGFGGEPAVKDHLEDPDVDGRIILRWILRK